MSSNKDFLQKTFKENQTLSEFKIIVGLMKKNNIKLGITRKAEHGPAYVTSRINQDNNKIGSAQVVVNTYHPLDAVKTALDHELTHVHQKIIMEKMVKAGANANVKSSIGYTLLTESHAFSNQADFAVKRYMQKISMGKTRNTPEQKTIEYLIQNGVNTAPIVESYINTFKDYFPKSKKSLNVIDTIKQFHRLASLSDIETAHDKARKNSFKAFFKGKSDTYPLNIPTFYNNETVDAYIDEALKNTEHNSYSSNSYKKEMPLEVAAISLFTNNKPFVTADQIQEFMGIETVSDIADKFISSSKRKNEFINRINKLS